MNNKRILIIESKLNKIESILNKNIQLRMKDVK